MAGNRNLNRNVAFPATTRLPMTPNRVISTKNRAVYTILAISSLLGLGACKQSNAESQSKAAKVQESSKAKHTISIPSLSVRIDADFDAELSDDTKRAHFPTATLYTDPTIFVVGANPMFWQKDLPSQKADIRKAPGNTFKRFTKEIVLDGGFLLEFELSSMMEERETLYGFHLRRTIDGQEFDCSCNTISLEKMAKAASICDSLRAI